MMKALFWDYDGTLVDTRKKNYHVTKKIIQDVTNGRADEFIMLRSYENYISRISEITNWRNIYQEEFGFSETETDRVGFLWTDYQAADNTPTPVYDGIVEVIRSFSDCSQVIVSQNASGNIRSVLRNNDIENYFDMVIGFEEVDIRKQKPDPYGVLYSIDKIGSDRISILYYIGDHEADVTLTKNTNAALRQRKSEIIVKSITVNYENNQNIDSWKDKPDYIALKPPDIIGIINSECT